MARDIKDIISKMTLKEKAGMCSGADFWRLKSVDRLGIPKVMVSDGPHGLRKQDDKKKNAGMNDAITTVCFPAACLTTSSFDRALHKNMGDALGRECQAENVSVLLGPAINIKRSPLCGRNFEYMSEDPYLAGEMASSYIDGVQSHHIGTSVKHFAANNQEYRRMSISSEVDDRALREIYLAAFETVVKKSQPYTIMASYNRVNGEFATENKKLLTDILRNEWGYKGYVVSDWGAVNNRVRGLQAGLDLEMPGGNATNDNRIVDAVKNGYLDEKLLDETVARILEKIYEYEDNRETQVIDLDEEYVKAKHIAEESFVLLKNDNILPLANKDKVAFIGEFAVNPRIQGGGSSHISSYKISAAYDFVKDSENVSYAQGYQADVMEPDDKLISEAVELAKKVDKAVLFVGLPDIYESESYDRDHMRLPEGQTKLIEEVLKVQSNVVIVLHNGSPVEMPWVDDIKGILEVYLAGDATGEATVDTLYGKVNPSGKLAETFPIKLEDTPAYLNFPGDGNTVNYAEGIFVGYRYYDKKQMDVLFPFGYGLSYTKFRYDSIRLSAKNIDDHTSLVVEVDVTNVGSRAGKEVVQLYVQDNTNGSVVRPVKELKGFEKISLDVNETKTVKFTLDRRSFAWFLVRNNDWFVNSGEYKILVGSSSRDIKLSDTVNYASNDYVAFTVDDNTPIGNLMGIPKIESIVDEIIALIPYLSPEGSEAVGAKMQESMVVNNPLRALKSFNTNVTDEMLKNFEDRINQLL